MPLSPLLARRLTEEQQSALDEPTGELVEVRRAHDVLARRYAPVFVQSVERYVRHGRRPRPHRPWRDFILPLDFDHVETDGEWRPNWPSATAFCDESALQEKVDRLRLLERPDAVVGDVRMHGRDLVEVSADGARVALLDLRPTVYYTVLTHRQFVTCHYVVYHADSSFTEESVGPGDDGYHAGDLEGASVLVDVGDERVLAILCVYHNEVRQVINTDRWRYRYFTKPLRDRLAEEDISATEDGERWRVLPMSRNVVLSDRPLRHVYVSVESGTHAQDVYTGRPHGPSIVYYLDREDHHARPPLTPDAYTTDKHRFPLVPYALEYIGANRLLPARRTLWSSYCEVGPVAYGMNAPWRWRATNHPRSDWSWWANPVQFTLGIPTDPDEYTFNPYFSEA